MIPLRLARSLRSVVALLTLASAGAVQSATLECPMAGDVRATGEHAHDVPHAVHVRQARGPETASDRAPEADDGSTSHRDADCAMPLGCGAPIIDAPVASVAYSGAPTPEAPQGFTAKQYATVFPAQEPPPPRFHV